MYIYRFYLCLILILHKYIRLYKSVPMKSQRKAKILFCLPYAKRMPSRRRQIVELEFVLL